MLKRPSGLKIEMQIGMAEGVGMLACVAEYTYTFRYDLVHNEHRQKGREHLPANGSRASAESLTSWVSTGTHSLQLVSGARAVKATIGSRSILERNL